MLNNIIINLASYNQWAIIADSRPYLRVTIEADCILFLELYIWDNHILPYLLLESSF
jgi:hypothetical protein